LERIKPVESLRVEALGRAWPVGYAVMNPKNPGGITVMLNEYAWALDGMPQLLLD
jgi:hypothetical protein